MASEITVTPGSDQRREERLRVQTILWEHSSLQSVVKATPGRPEAHPTTTTPLTCGQRAVNPSGLVGVRITPGPAGGRNPGFSGLGTCGSVWACPTCNAKIASRRSEELSDAVTEWERLGGYVALVTLTMRHHKHQSLLELWSALSYAWSKSTSGRGWARDSAHHGTVINGKKRLPWARAVEVTHGKNGWHVHVHALVFLKGDVKLDVLSESMFARWSNALTSKGMRAPIQDKGGLDARVIESNSEAPAAVSAGYLAKSTYAYTAESAGWEVAGGAMKDARMGNRSAFRILRDFVATGDLDDLDLWHEYEQASRGRMQLTWSRGLREFLALEVEETDEKIAAEEIGDEDIQMVDPDEWRALRYNKALIMEAADTFELDYLRTHLVTDWLIRIRRRQNSDRSIN